MMTTILRKNAPPSPAPQDSPAPAATSEENSSALSDTSQPAGTRHLEDEGAPDRIAAPDDLDIPDDADFSSFMEGRPPARPALTAGAKIQATVVSVNDEWIFLDIGAKSEGMVARTEFTDKEGALTVRPGDLIEVHFLQDGKNGKRFTRRLGGSDTSIAELEEAYRGEIPVEGEVTEEIKGGYLVKIGKTRAFCPYSQLGIRRSEDDNPVGSCLRFKIIEIREHGKSVVVSRRLLLEEERRQRLRELQQSLRVGQCVAGTVTSVRDFGAFVDIGGLEGLIPAREISWDSSLSAADVLQPGDKVEVEILSLDWGKERFAFSLKKAGLDPWTGVGEHFPAGATVQGTVCRLMPFGAFIRLAPGIEGLVHISRLGGRNLKHPKETLELGQPLTVRIESTDAEKRRIALLPADLTQLKQGAGKQDDQTQNGSEEDVAAYLASRREHSDSASTMEALLRQAAAKAREKRETKGS